MHTHTQSTGVKTYSFNTVFGPHATQEDVYQSVGAPLVSHLLSGNNVFVFA